MSELQVSKTNYTKTRIVASKLDKTELEAGQVLVKVDSFSFTANNITYALVGDMFGYWQFFPAQDNADQQWGILPVWGYADVVSSKHDDVPVGERIFGYFPPADHLLMSPVHLNGERWIDGAEHRKPLPQGYNVYRRVSDQPEGEIASEEERMLLFPLHITSFSLYDYLQQSEWFGAEQIVIASASSKTSIGLGFGLNLDADAPSCIALTSARNVSSVEKLGIYQQVVTYDNLSELDASKKTVIVDMSGNKALMATIHTTLADNMIRTVSVGFTHWQAGGESDGFNDDRSEMFFAPGHIQERSKEIGLDEFDRLSNAYMAASIAHSRQWLKLTTVEGLSGLNGIFDDVCNGRMVPETGLIVKMA